MSRLLDGKQCSNLQVIATCADKNGDKQSAVHFIVQLNRTAQGICSYSS